jgi:streptothricin acetyltransferase
VDLVIREDDGQAGGDGHGLDGSFLVESELALFAEGGVIRYEIVPVPPYEKRYAEGEPSVDPGSPGRAVFLASLDGSVAGRIALSEGWNRMAWIDDIAVDARHRRAGVGRTLIDRAVAWAVERGSPAVRAETQHNNVPACKLYESCGFHLGGFDRDLYRGLDGGTTEVALFWYLHLREPPARPRTGGPSV